MTTTRSNPVEQTWYHVPTVCSAFRSQPVAMIALLTPSVRETALDRLRGVVMILMVHDHSGSFFNASHLTTDSIALPQPDGGLPIVPFLLRLITHLCAPTFVFLAGTALYLSVSRERGRGVSPLRIDCHIAKRGAVLIALELTVVSASWAPFYQGFSFYLQVIWAIGAAFLLMVGMRRLPVWSLVGLAITYLVLSDWIVLDLLGWTGRPRETPWLEGILFSFSWTSFGPESTNSLSVTAIYPVFPWFSMLLLGWAFGCALERCRARRRSPTRFLLVAGLVALGAYFSLRAGGGYGEMGLVRRDTSFQEWFHPSKYPPSLTFTLLTLGSMAWTLAALFRCSPVQEASAKRAIYALRDPLLVFGSTPLFFYVLHLPLLAVIAKLSGFDRPTGDAGDAFCAMLATLVLLYPTCCVYARLKSSRRHAWTRYL